MYPTSYLFGSWFALNPVFLLADALSFGEKAAKVLLYFRLDCGMLQFFTHEPMSLPLFWSMVRRKSSRFEHTQTVIQTSRRMDSFCMQRLGTLNSYQIFKIKNKKYNRNSIYGTKTSKEEQALWLSLKNAPSDSPLKSCYKHTVKKGRQKVLWLCQTESVKCFW